MNETSPPMKPFERIALAHIAQELLWDPGLIPLSSFNRRQRGGIMLLLRRMADEGAAEAGRAGTGDIAPRRRTGRRPGS